MAKKTEIKNTDEVTAKDMEDIFGDDFEGEDLEEQPIFTSPEVKQFSLDQELNKPRDPKTEVGHYTGERDSSKITAPKGSIERGKIRTAIVFDVPIEHLSNVIMDLNGKKVDGFFVHDLIGRYGFFNGEIMNREDVARYRKRSKEEVEIATKRLKTIVIKKNTREAYVKYYQGRSVLSGKSEIGKAIEAAIG